jgi:hypothetical protein
MPVESRKGGHHIVQRVVVESCCLFDWAVVQAVRRVIAVVNCLNVEQPNLLQQQTYQGPTQAIYDSYYAPYSLNHSPVEETTRLYHHPLHNVVAPFPAFNWHYGLTQR